jgi:hypothetical protein
VFYIGLASSVPGDLIPQAEIGPDKGGHAAPVHSFQSAGSFLFSADRIGMIKVE